MTERWRIYEGESESFAVKLRALSKRAPPIYR
jgi:hypothetical protein